MLIVSSTVGSPTSTGWKRRSSAASFSMYLRYSSSVVAPIVCSSPRASIGLSMFEASIEPSAAPAPTTVCSSSMKRMILPFGVGDLLEHGLEALLELAAVLRAGDERAHVERDDPLVLEAFGHVAADDAAGQAFDDGGLADAGLADEHRVVLRAARQHLDDAADLLVAADDRIELALARQLGQVAAVALERLVLAFGVLVVTRCEPRTLVSAAKILSRVRPRSRQQLRGGRAAGLGGDGEEQVLGADELVLQPLGLGLRQVGDELEPRREARLRAAVGLRHLRQQLARARGDLRRVGGHLAQHLGHDAVALLDERDEQVLGLDLRVARSARRAAARRATASWAFSVNLLMFMTGLLPTSRSRRLTRPDADAGSEPRLCLRALELLQRLEVRRAAPAVSVRGSCTSTVAYRSPGLVRLADRRHAVALQPEDLPVLRRRRHLEPQRLAAERRHRRPRRRAPPSSPAPARACTGPCPCARTRGAAASRTRR